MTFDVGDYALVKFRAAFNSSAGAPCRVVECDSPELVTVEIPVRQADGTLAKKRVHVSDLFEPSKEKLEWITERFKKVEG